MTRGVASAALLLRLTSGPVSRAEAVGLLEAAHHRTVRRCIDDLREAGWRVRRTERPDGVWYALDTASARVLRDAAHDAEVPERVREWREVRDLRRRLALARAGAVA